MFLFRFCARALSWWGGGFSLGRSLFIYLIRCHWPKKNHSSPNQNESEKYINFLIFYKNKQEFYSKELCHLYSKSSYYIKIKRQVENEKKIYFRFDSKHILQFSKIKIFFLCFWIIKVLNQRPSNWYSLYKNVSTNFGCLRVNFCFEATWVYSFIGPNGKFKVYAWWLKDNKDS